MEEFGEAGVQAGIEVWKVETTEGLERSLHFWIGKKSSAADKDVVAAFAQKLGDLLDPAPVAYRECEGHECAIFCALFTNGVRYIDEVDPSTKLYQVKGKRNVRVTQLATVSVTSMNKGDCFILCTPTQIWVYFGKFSKSCERYKALHAAGNIKAQDYSGDENDIEIIQVKQNSEQSVVEDFFAALGGGTRDLLADPPEEDDDDDEMANVEVQNKKTSVTLYRVSDSSGSMLVDKIGVDNLSSEMLNPSDCFILDPSGVPDIFVWLGSSSAQTEKTEAFSCAEKFLKSKGYPLWTNIQKVLGGAETTAFKQYFTTWTDSIEKEEKPKKLAKHQGSCNDFCPDDGSGKAELWRVENFQLAPVPAEKYGVFYRGDSYVLRYTYEEDGEEKYILYYWQGKDSTSDEIGASAMHAVKLDEELQLRAVMVRVLQGEEPSHFLRIFKGRMVVYLGGHVSAFKKVGEENEEIEGEEQGRLFHVRGTCDWDTRAVEVELKSGSLDSDDVFILNDKGGQTYIWIGTSASEREIETGKGISDLVAPDGTKIEVQEGEEPPEFFELLGGKGPYNDALGRMTKPERRIGGPRLFHCYIPLGKKKLVVEEVFNFRQEDLEEDDVMVLDSGGDEIFIWIGKGSTPEEKIYSHRLADDYIATSYMRSGGICVTVAIVLKQRYEADVFKKHFPTWDNNYWKD
ncbi:gelsolin, cytoplasmic isoform X2 [Folsomia candida]|uniref:gelsolin, cytoplasmic isoform X2 n=1 Tax=Folsomia candida TaxID=158441 RepID=UPI001604D03C|nr:gelsolin, cytoplasmic isoform X2 [Folsomia candida]